MYFDARGMTTLRIYAANKEKISTERGRKKLCTVDHMNYKT